MAKTLELHLQNSEAISAPFSRWKTGGEVLNDLLQALKGKSVLV